MERIGRRRVVCQVWRSWYTGGVKQFGHRAGRGGDVIPVQGARRSARSGRVFSASSLFLCPADVSADARAAVPRCVRPIPATAASISCRTAPGPGIADCALAQGGQSRLSGPIRLEAACKVLAFGIPVLLIPGRAAGRPARADPDAAGRADGLCRADRGDPSAGAAAGGTGELDHRRVRLHSEALRFHAAQHHLSRRGRRQGLDLRHLFAAARQSQPYRLQRAVAVAVRQRAGAPVRSPSGSSYSWR